MRLSTLYHSLSNEQREALAQAADISSGYLYQLATRWENRKPSVPMMVKLVAADDRLTLADLAEEFTESPAVRPIEHHPKVVGQLAQQPAAKKALARDDDFDPTTSIDNSSKG